MSKKMGRPLSDNPCRNPIGCKITDEELQRLNEYCKENNITKSEVIKKSITPIINPKSESE